MFILGGKKMNAFLSYFTNEITFQITLYLFLLVPLNKYGSVSNSLLQMHIALESQVFIYFQDAFKWSD